MRLRFGRKRTILVLRQLGGIGDCLMMSCVYRGLRETYPDHRIVCATSALYQAGNLTDIAEHNPFIDEVLRVEPWEMTTVKTMTTWPEIGRQNDIAEADFWKRADKTIDLNTACVDYEMPAMRSPEGIRKPRWQIWCEAAGVTPSSYDPVYAIRKDEQVEADAWVREHWPKGVPVIGLGVTAAHKNRAMGIGKVMEIADRLQKADCYPVIVDPTFSLDGVPALNGKRLRELMPLVRRMDALISVDSGLLHVAGAVDTPVIGVFGPTDPAMRMNRYRGSATLGSRWMDCAPCWYEYPCENDPNRESFECMNRIPAEILVDETLRWVRSPQRTVLPVVG
jgi:ADP-heptose:LPS heptosyltransferase